MWIDKIIEMLREIYRTIPPRFRWIIDPFAFAIACPMQLRLDLWSAKGTLLNSDMPLSVLCAAPDKDRSYFINYFLELVYGKSFEEVYHGHTWLWNIPEVLKKEGQDCSMMIVNMPKYYRYSPKTQNFFNIGYVEGEVDIPINECFMKKDSLKSDIRKIKKHAFNFEVTRDPRCFFKFYHEMFVPHKAKRFGKAADICQFGPRFQRNRDLLLIKKSGETVAGVTVCYERDVPILGDNGILDGDSKYIKEGALSASYYYMFLYLEKKGFKKVNLGGSSPFFHDGVLKYKTKWSQKIMHSEATFALKILSNTLITRTFLQNNPFIFESKGKLYGTVFVDKDNPFSLEELKQIDKDYFIPGLSKLFIYSFQPDYALKEEKIPLELSEHIILRSAKHIFD
jgi:hypothetical protein